MKVLSSLNSRPFELQIYAIFQYQKHFKAKGGLTPRAADKSGDSTGYGESALNEFFRPLSSSRQSPALAANACR
jgi:hypothetical protein